MGGGNGRAKSHLQISKEVLHCAVCNLTYIHSIFLLNLNPQNYGNFLNIHNAFIPKSDWLLDCAYVFQRF